MEKKDFSEISKYVFFPKKQRSSFLSMQLLIQLPRFESNSPLKEFELQS